jgi:hypothetical protein
MSLDRQSARATAIWGAGHQRLWSIMPRLTSIFPWSRLDTGFRDPATSAARMREFDLSRGMSLRSPDCSARGNKLLTDGIRDGE